MTQDFAKHQARADTSAPLIPGWVSFSTGLLAGIFLSFLIYLWKVVPADPETSDISEIPKAQPNPAAKQPREEMQWGFYEIFPKSEVPIVEEFDNDGKRVESEASYSYLLQAGSFKNPTDADQLRARLILLGLDVFLKKINVEGQTWHRVMVGPLKTTLDLNRAQDTLAQAEIEALPIRVKL